MKRTFLQPLAAVLAVLAATTLVAARETNAQPRTAGVEVARFDLSSFKIIAERNIFNPNRSLRGEDRTTRREPDRRVRTESFALLGTMSYEKGRFAFFDGSTSDYKKVLQSAGQIAGFKVIAVAPTCVRLEGTNGQSIELCVGMQMSKREEEDWRIQERTTSASSSSASGSPESSDVLKRLMARRESEGAPGSVPASDLAPAAAETRETSSNSNSEPDEVVRRLLQKREQELNK